MKQKKLKKERISKIVLNVGIVGKLNKEDIFVVLDVKDILGGIILKNEKKTLVFKPLTATIMLFLILCLAQFSMVLPLNLITQKGYDKSVGAYGKYEIKKCFWVG